MTEVRTRHELHDQAWRAIARPGRMSWRKTVDDVWIAYNHGTLFSDLPIQEAKEEETPAQERERQPKWALPSKKKTSTSKMCCVATMRLAQKQRGARRTRPATTALFQVSRRHEQGRRRSISHAWPQRRNLCVGMWTEPYIWRYCRMGPQRKTHKRTHTPWSNLVGSGLATCKLRRSAKDGPKKTDRYMN